MPKLKRAGDADNRGATDFIESLDRGLRVLEVFGGSRQPMTLSDLAKAADLPRATARRILFTLERAGFVATDGKLFRLMPRVLVLAASLSRAPTMSSRCCSRRSTGCRARRRKFRRWRSSTATTSSSSPAPARRGYFPPASTSATACRRSAPRSAACCCRGCPTTNWRKRSNAMDLAPLTPFTVTDKKLLLKTIIADRAKGYSLVDREAEPGFPLDLGAGPPLRRRHRRRHQHGRACRPRVISRDGRTLSAAPARGGGRCGEVDAGVSERNDRRFPARSHPPGFSAGIQREAIGPRHGGEVVASRSRLKCSPERYLAPLDPVGIADPAQCFVARTVQEDRKQFAAAHAA